MAGDLVLEYGFKPSQTSLLNQLFVHAMNSATKSLVSVSSNLRAGNHDRWKIRDHLRFMVMLLTWMAVWVLRVLTDNLPFLHSFSPCYLLGGYGSDEPHNLALRSSETAMILSSGASIDFPLHRDVHAPSVNALIRTLTHILALLNEISASSRKYQFAMTMAENIMEGNFRYGLAELVEVNRVALSSAFGRTLNLLCRCLRKAHAPADAWTSRLLRILPLGPSIVSYARRLNYFIGAVVQAARSSSLQLEKRQLGGRLSEGMEGVMAEKLAEELLWITNKLRAYGAVDEAMVQWSYASELASLSLVANHRVQGSVVKISALLVGDLTKGSIEVSGQVKLRLLLFWLPLFCHANNGVSYPILTTFERAHVEKAIDEVMSTLPVGDQEAVLSNWVQDYAVASSDWPNLEHAYHRWCDNTRELAM